MFKKTNHLFKIWWASFLGLVIFFFKQTPILAATPPSIFGEISPPPGVDAYNAGAASGIGIIVFISNMIKLVTIIAGIWVMFNFILAGFDYITGSGDSGAHKKVIDRITFSVVGLVIIIAAYTGIALISLVLFGDPGFILNPSIEGPTPSP